jgi:hypothetical protein
VVLPQAASSRPSASTPKPKRARIVYSPKVKAARILLRGTCGAKYWARESRR